MAKSGWAPGFIDYLYVSVTNSSAFSPTDTMPLSVRAKLLMAVESVSALTLSVLVISFGVGLLNTDQECPASPVLSRRCLVAVGSAGRGCPCSRAAVVNAGTVSSSEKITEAAMWHAMFAEQIPLAEKVLRTVIVYALIAVLFRLTGKRGLASLNTFDVVVIFLLSNVVQNAIIGNDTSLTGGVVGAVTLVAVNTGVNHLIAVSATAARVFDGQATAVICDGHPVARALRRLGMRRSELDTAARLQGSGGITDIDRGSMEPGGQLVLTLKTGQQGATKSDVAELTSRLRRIENLLSASR